MGENENGPVDGPPSATDSGPEREPRQPSAYAGRFTASDGLRGWSEARSRRMPCYGAGSIEVSGPVLTLRGWQRTWLGASTEAEILVATSGVRNVARDGALVHCECRIGRRWKNVDFTAGSEVEAAIICGLLPTMTTAGFATAWEELRSFTRDLDALPTSAWITPLLVAVNAAAYLLVAVSSRSPIFIDQMQLTRLGANYGLLTSHGEWWRLLTATFLHASFAHLALNMWVLWGVGRLTERLYGSWAYLAIYVCAGVLASLSSTAWVPGLTSVGASGAIFGILGAFIAFMLHARTRVPSVVVRAHRTRTILFVAFNLISGAFSPIIDNAAHVGGLISGFALGWLLARPIGDERAGYLSLPRVGAAVLLVAGLMAVGVSQVRVRDPDPGGPYEFWSTNRWYPPAESRNVREWAELAAKAQFGTISDAELERRFQTDVLPFWTATEKRLRPSIRKSDQGASTFGALILEFVALRKDWAQSMIQRLGSDDESKTEGSRDFLREQNLLQARIDRTLVRDQLDHGHKGIRASLIDSLRTWMARRTWTCVRPEGAFGRSSSEEDAASDGPAARLAAGCEAQRLFLTHDYVELDRRMMSHAEHHADLADGGSTLAGEISGLDTLFDSGKLEPQELLVRLSDWRREVHGSALPQLVEAIMYSDWAWSVRGGGYRKTVSSQAWQVFAYRTQLGAATLEELGDRGTPIPAWYQVSIDSALDQSLEVEQIRAIFDAGIARFPNYAPIYRSMVRVLLPRWGGSEAEIANFIDDVSRSSRDREATYAQLYWTYASLEGDETNIFDYGRADWARIDTGLRKLIDRYPRSDYLINIYASLACERGDASSYTRIRDQLDGRVSSAAWTKERSLKGCDERFQLGESPLLRQQVQAALNSAEPMQLAITRYSDTHGELPAGESDLRSVGFVPADSTGAEIRLGAGGSIDVTMVGGRLDGRALSLIPHRIGGKVSWNCAQGTVPPEYLVAPCL
jgi:rhomboid protease GluP